jgi:hypothetical protein
LQEYRRGSIARIRGGAIFGGCGIRQLLTPLLVCGCGGSLVDAGADGGSRMDGGRGGQGARAMYSDADSLGDAFPMHREDACPDAPFVPPPLRCDPFAQGTQCRSGEACYPIPPRATDGCRPGTYATACLPEGTGRQGAPCDDGTDCAGGYVCVTSGLGDLCLQLCRTGEVGACSDGLVCSELDITGSGWGACD